MRLHLPFTNRIPSKNVFVRLFYVLNPEVFKICFIEWAKSFQKILNELFVQFIMGWSLIMGLLDSGFEKEVVGKTVNICVNENHPLLKLAKKLPWEDMLDWVMPDLKQTTAKGL